MKVSLTTQVISAVCAVTLIGPLGARAMDSKTIHQGEEGQEKRELNRLGRLGKKPEKQPALMSSVSVPDGFNRPAWAVSTSAADDDEEDAQVFVTYKQNEQIAIKKAMDELDSKEQLSWSTTNTGGGRRPKPFAVKYDFTDLNTYVVRGSKRKLKELMNQFGNVIEAVEDDLIRNSQEFLGELSEEDLGDANIDQKHRMLAQEIPYGITMVEAPLLWSGYGSAGSVTGSGVKVCVVDSGIQRSNPDFIASNLSGLSSQVWYEDGCTHGTHCSGTIAAANNNAGVVGVAYNAKIHSIKVFGTTGTTSCRWSYSSGLIDATTKCREAGAKVISMSLGGGGYSANEANHYKKLFEEDGILTVAAAGNDGDSTFSYPASYPFVMSVAAVNSSKNKASFSQYNSQVDIAAPGVSTLSTVNNGYGYKSGTSMATPHVAGVAALLFEHFSTDDPVFDVRKIREAIEVTAEDRGTPGRDDQFGHGIVQAYKAFEWLDRNSSPTKSPSPTTSPAPTPGPANVKLDLLTDNYGGETSWRITKEGIEVESNGGYESAQRYIEEYTLAPGDYIFRIDDTWGDGICCAYGVGSYTFYAEGAVVATGASFGYFDATSFTIGTSDPDPTASPTVAPTASPTGLPTKNPSKAPSSFPSRIPTSNPSTTPSNRPTETPTSIPSKSPSSEPTSIPSASPSITPTGSPISGPGPTESPTGSPIKSPTGNPTKSPTASPSKSPTENPTGTPSKSPSSPTGGTWVELEFEGFEDGWGAWKDGGSDVRLSRNDRRYAHTGDGTVRLRDDSSTSTLTREPMDVASFAQLKFSFWFYTRSFESGDGFFLEASIDDGEWEILKSWRIDADSGNPNVVDIHDDAFFFGTVELSIAEVTNVVWRIRCDANTNFDYMYVDDITIEGFA